MTKKIKNILISVLLILLIVSGVYFYSQMKVTTNAESFSNNISESVVSILELSSLEYNYTDVMSHKESSKINDFDIPFTEKKFLIKYTGYIKAGSDLSDIEVEVVNSDTINIKLNHSVITDNVINEDDLYVYDEKESIFNKLTISDVYSVFAAEKAITEDKVIDNGFLKEADENAKELITELLKSMDFTDIHITFK